LSATILTFDADNNVIDRLTYSVTVDALNRYQFEILDEQMSNLPIPYLVADIS